MHACTHAHPYLHTWTHSHTHTHTDPSTVGLQREVLLALQWINFQHEPSDLHLLFTNDLYTKMVALAGVVTTKVIPKTVSTTPNRLEDRVRCACALTMQLLGLTVG